MTAIITLTIYAAAFYRLQSHIFRQSATSKEKKKRAWTVTVKVLNHQMHGLLIQITMSTFLLWLFKFSAQEIASLCLFIHIYVHARKGRNHRNFSVPILRPDKAAQAQVSEQKKNAIAENSNVLKFLGRVQATCKAKSKQL